MGTQPLPTKGEPPSQFSAHFYCGQTAGCIKMPLGMELGLSPGNFVLHGDPALYPRRGGAHPIFGTSIVAKRLHGSRCHLVGKYSPRARHCVRCGPSYPQKKGHTHHHPIFGPCLLWPNGWMDEDAAWYGSRPRSRPHVVLDGDPPPRKGHSSPPLLGAWLMWPRSPISATAELL